MSRTAARASAIGALAALALVVIPPAPSFAGDQVPASTTITQDLTLVAAARPDTVDTAGDVVGYSFQIGNAGAMAFDGLHVEVVRFTGGGPLGPITCPVTTLAPGARTTCSARYSAAQADVDAGSIALVAAAVAVPAGSSTAQSSPYGSCRVLADARPALTMSASASPRTVIAAGDITRYSFVVTNTGTVTLTDVGVDAGAFSGTGTPPAPNCPTTTLAPRAAVTCTGRYAVTQADVDAGSIELAASARGTPPQDAATVRSPLSRVTVRVVTGPAIALEHTVDPTQVQAAGQEVTFAYLITDTGTTVLSDIGVTGYEFTGTGTPSAIHCPVSTLAPAQTTTCTSTYLVTQDDVDTGYVFSAAFAHGNPSGVDAPQVDSAPSYVEVDSPGPVELRLEKSASPSDALTVGEQLTYSFVVTNVGRKTAVQVRIVDTFLGSSGVLADLHCPGGRPSLLPGAQFTCTALYTVTQDDVDLGSVDNTAIAVGRGAGINTQTSASPPSGVVVPFAPGPGLTLSEPATPTMARAGDHVPYTFTATNTGNLTLTGVHVVQRAFSGAGRPPVVACPAMPTVAPGARLTCAGSYLATQADIDRGSISGILTATARTLIDETPVRSSPLRATVTAAGSGRLRVRVRATTVDVDRDRRLDPGDRVVWRVRVSNTGAPTVRGIRVLDPVGGPVTCPQDVLAPGATMSCTVRPRTITDADVGRAVVDTVEVTGTNPDGNPSRARLHDSDTARTGTVLAPRPVGRRAGPPDGSARVEGRDAVSQQQPGGERRDGLSVTGPPVVRVLGAAGLVLLCGTILVVLGRRPRSRRS